MADMNSIYTIMELALKYRAFVGVSGTAGPLLMVKYRRNITCRHFVVGGHFNYREGLEGEIKISEKSDLHSWINRKLAPEWQVSTQWWKKWIWVKRGGKAIGH
jgi:hypothetical protein